MASKPVAVLISDIHFTPATLELASESLKKAKQLATDLSIPLVLAGDTLDSKAIIRGEVANRLIEIFNPVGPETYVLVGNHDLLNEKGKEHSLNFLTPYVDIVQNSVELPYLGYLIPYQNDANKFRELLTNIPKGSTIICHQGLSGANMGHYVLDKTAINKEDVKDYRVISGHYHKRQDIKTGRPRKGAVGLWSYIGNPYSLSFGEANDGPKGFQILHDDGLLEFVPTNLRKHVLFEANIRDKGVFEKYSADPEDKVWIKLSGPATEIKAIKKSNIAALINRTDFKLDLIPTEYEQLDVDTEKVYDEDILDQLIDNTDESKATKAELKDLWRHVLE